MPENIYDQKSFFDKYSHMLRSEKGLEGAGEWHELEKLLPDFQGKRVLDLGCGFGWHCRYAAEHGAARVIGVDLSENMLREAKHKTASPVVTYQRASIEEYDCPEGAFDIVISSLALHYVADFALVCDRVWRALSPDGDWIFSVEHPMFTAYGTQDWIYDADGQKHHWPVDCYFEEGPREAVFLGENVQKQHHTLTTYLNGTLQRGFALKAVMEPQPAPHLMDLPGMRDELRRPMLLLVAAAKAGERREWNGCPDS